MYGWMGRILQVDLTKRKSKIIEISKDSLMKFIGGRGLGAYFLFKFLNAKINPLSRENLLVFSVGPLTGTLTPCSGRCTVVSKSPLTGTVFDSNAGGPLGPEIKYAGYDAIIIKGVSESPTLIIIDDDEVLLENANGLWGLKTSETFSSIKRDYGRDFKVACIGPAGENQVLFSCIATCSGNFFGRGGLGAVMGSKKLKAIAIRGDRKVSVFNEEQLMKLREEAIKRVKMNPVTGKALPRFGTPFLVRVIDEINALPTKNFNERKWVKAEIFSGENISRYVIRRRACPMCPIACKFTTKFNEIETHGPEFESLWALGINCQLDSLEKVAYVNMLCNEYGLDTISTGGVMACLMELSESGILGEAKIEWGDFEVVKEVLIKIVNRVSIGKLASLGAERLARHFNASGIAMTVKGLELPAYDPREVYGQALAYATSNRGGCHLRSYMISMEVLGLPILIERRTLMFKPDLVALNQDFLAVIDSLVLCKFITLELDDEFITHILTAVTGIEFDRGKLLKTGERIWNLERLFNIREGFTKESDKLPSRLMREIPLSEMIEKYYEVRGWSNRGKPKLEKLRELGLEWVSI